MPAVTPRNKSDEVSLGSFVYVAEPFGTSNSSNSSSNSEETYGESEIDGVDNYQTQAAKQRITVASSTPPKKRKKDISSSEACEVSVPTRRYSSHDARGGMHRDSSPATRPRSPDSTNQYDIGLDIDLRTPRVVPFGWIKHPGTKMWRAIVKEFSDNRERYRDWSNDIGEQVHARLQEADFDYYQNIHVVVGQEPACKKQKSPIGDIGGSDTGRCRKASYDDFLRKTKERFIEDRKTRTLKKKKAAAQATPSETQANQIHLATSAPERASRWVREPYYSIKRKTVCLESKHHYGTLNWCQVVQTFSNDFQRYPTWTDEIAALVKDQLDEDDFAPILVFRDPYGRPCKPFQDGLWVLALDKEVKEITRNQFLQNRKLLKHPPAVIVIQGSNGDSSSGERDDHASQDDKPYNGSPPQNNPDTDSSSSGERDDHPSQDGKPFDDTPPQSDLDAYNSELTLTFGKAGKVFPLMENQMMEDADQSDLVAIEQEEEGKASDDEMESAVSEEEEEDEAEVIRVYDVDDDDSSDDEASTHYNTVEQSLPQDAFSSYRDIDLSSSTGSDAASSTYTGHSGAQMVLDLSPNLNWGASNQVDRMVSIERINSLSMLGHSSDEAWSSPGSASATLSQTYDDNNQVKKSLKTGHSSVSDSAKPKFAVQDDDFECLFDDDFESLFESLEQDTFMAPNDARDVCFGLWRCPGTKAWRDAVHAIAKRNDHLWSKSLYEEIRRELEGRRFWVREQGTWRTASEDEISEKTIQRFRDARKPRKNWERRRRPSDLWRSLASFVNEEIASYRINAANSGTNGQRDCGTNTRIAHLELLKERLEVALSGDGERSNEAPTASSALINKSGAAEFQENEHSSLFSPIHAAMTSNISMETRTVILGSVQHPLILYSHTETWLDVLHANFSSNLEEYPTWSDDIAAIKMKPLLEKQGIHRFLVYVNQDGIPVDNVVAGGRFRDATAFEILEHTQQQFQKDRRLLPRVAVTQSSRQ